MKSFSDLKNIKLENKISKNAIQEILSELSVQSNVELNDNSVEIIGIDEVEISLQEHIEEVKRQTVKETISIIEESLKNGQHFSLIVEKLLSNQ